MKGGDITMSKALFAMMALVVGLMFGSATFVQADEKAAAPAAPAAAPVAPAGDKKEMKGEMKSEKGDKKESKKGKKKEGK
jgi:hypothetical protein